MEGCKCFAPSSGCNKDGKVKPILDYSHSAGRCAVTGGYVYRGSNIPALVGWYVFADYCSGEIWAVGVHRGQAREQDPAPQHEPVDQLVRRERQWRAVRRRPRRDDLPHRPRLSCGATGQGATGGWTRAPRIRSMDGYAAYGRVDRRRAGAAGSSSPAREDWLSPDPEVIEVADGATETLAARTVAPRAHGRRAGAVGDRHVLPVRRQQLALARRRLGRHRRRAEPGRVGRRADRRIARVGLARARGPRRGRPRPARSRSPTARARPRRTAARCPGPRRPAAARRARAAGRTPAGRRVGDVRDRRQVAGARAAQPRLEVARVGLRPAGTSIPATVRPAARDEAEARSGSSASSGAPASGSIAASMSASSSTWRGGDASASSTITPQNGRIGRHVPVGSTSAGRPRAGGDHHRARASITPSAVATPTARRPSRATRRGAPPPDVRAARPGERGERVGRGRRRDREPDRPGGRRRGRRPGPARGAAAPPRRRTPAGSRGWRPPIAAARPRSHAASVPSSEDPGGLGPRGGRRAPGAASGSSARTSSASVR